MSATQPSPRLRIASARIEKGTIVITAIEIFEPETGEVKRIANITPQLLDFLLRLEIDISLWADIENLKAKNPAVTKLISTFNLYT